VALVTYNNQHLHARAPFAVPPFTLGVGIAHADR